MTASDRQFSPAADRNRAPMLAVLQRVLPDHGRALEIASGTGQHAAWFARHLPGWTWQPTDVQPGAFASIAAWTADDANALAPRLLDVLSDPWPVAGPFDAILCANLLHIAPWACCGGLARGAARLLAREGRLVTYGPYLEDDVPTAAGNLAFDADLRRRDASWGIRRLADVAAEARAAGLRLRERVEMPANNLMLVFERDEETS